VPDRAAAFVGVVAGLPAVVVRTVGTPWARDETAVVDWGESLPTLLVIGATTIEAGSGCAVGVSSRAAMGTPQPVRATMQAAKNGNVAARMCRREGRNRPRSSSPAEDTETIY
jgi:hypothetical protein